MNMQMSQGYQAYQRNKFETASPHRLILMLYDGALTNINRARAALEAGKKADAHNHLQKSQDIVFELIACLNEEQGGEIAANLRNIYMYVIERLVQANVRKDAGLLEEPENLLKQLREAWAQIGKEVSHGAI